MSSIVAALLAIFWSWSSTTADTEESTAFDSGADVISPETSFVSEAFTSDSAETSFATSKMSVVDFFPPDFEFFEDLLEVFFESEPEPEPTN